MSRSQCFKPWIRRIKAMCCSASSIPLIIFGWTSTLSLEHIWTSPDRVFQPLTTARSMWYRAHGMSSPYNPDDELKEIWSREISRGTASIWRGGAANHTANPTSHEPAMSPSTQGQFSTSSSQWSSGQCTHVSSKYNCIAIVQKKNAFGSLTCSWCHWRLHRK